jgi:spore maturation protein SpmA
MTTKKPITEARKAIIQSLSEVEVIRNSGAKVLTISSTFDAQLAEACAVAPFFAVAPIFSLYTPANTNMNQTAVGFVDFEVNVIALEDVAELECLDAVQALYELNDTQTTTESGQLAFVIANTPVAALSNYPYMCYAMTIRMALP